MYSEIKNNLEVQKKALEFLHADLQQEYMMLQCGKPERAEELARVITGLVQVAFEARVELKRMLGGRPLREVVAELDNERARPLSLLLVDLEYIEERCRKRSERNRIYARVLDEVQMMRIGALYGVLTGGVDAATERMQ